MMRLQPESEHPHGLSDREFDGLFTADKPVIFAYHGDAWLILRLTCRRTTTTTPSMSVASRSAAPPRRRSTW